MNTLNHNGNEQTHAVNPHRLRPTLVKKASLGFVTAATIVVLLVARPDVTSAGECKTTTGDCSTSIGLYIS
jgi:hypothetical protein